MKSANSLQNREVISIEDKGIIGTVESFVVDTSANKLKSFIIKGKKQGVELLLPLNKTTGIGDDYIVIPTSSVAADVKTDKRAGDIVRKSFALLGTPVVASAGTVIGEVTDFEIVEATGEITKVACSAGLEFAWKQILMITHEFVVIDMKELPEEKSEPVRLVTGKEGEFAAPAEPEPAPKPTKSSRATKKTAAPKETPALDLDVDDVETEAEKPAPKPAAKKTSDLPSFEDESRAFLLGNRVSQTVESEDGEFKVTKGTLLTDAILDEAAEHDALLLLTMAL